MHIAKLVSRPCHLTPVCVLNWKPVAGRVVVRLIMLLVFLYIMQVAQGTAWMWVARTVRNYDVLDAPLESDGSNALGFQWSPNRELFCLCFLQWNVKCWASAYCCHISVNFKRSSSESLCGSCGRLRVRIINLIQSTSTGSKLSLRTYFKPILRFLTLNHSYSNSCTGFFFSREDIIICKF